MNSAILETPGPHVEVPSRLRDFIQLTRPRIGAMSLVTVAVGYLLGAGNGFHWHDLFHVLLGTGLVASGASAVNQWMERSSDARMKRTARRPLPAARLRPGTVLLFGLALAGAGLGYLYGMLPQGAACLVAAITFTSYILLYTPLKRVTILNTVVGAVPGALPPVIGWAAARGSVDWKVLSLFTIIFIWQLPHFFAIAWLYREDYAAGGLRMLPAIDPDGTLTAQVMVGFCVLLIPVSMGPALLGMTGDIFLTGSVLLSIYFLVCAMDFRRMRSRDNARFVLKASLYYLLGLMVLLVLDGIFPIYFLGR